MSKHVFLADNKMANLLRDVHTFIAQTVPKYNFQYVHLTPLSSS